MFHNVIASYSGPSNHNLERDLDNLHHHMVALADHLSFLCDEESHGSSNLQGCCDGDCSSFCISFWLALTELKVKPPLVSLDGSTKVCYRGGSQSHMDFFVSNFPWKQAHFN